MPNFVSQICIFYKNDSHTKQNPDVCWQYQCYWPQGLFWCFRESSGNRIQKKVNKIFSSFLFQHPPWSPWSPYTPTVRMLIKLAESPWRLPGLPKLKVLTCLTCLKCLECLECLGFCKVFLYIYIFTFLCYCVTV